MKAHTHLSRGRRLIVFAIVIVLLTAVAAYFNARSGEQLLPYDKGELWVNVQAAERMLAGEEIYRPQEFRPFTYPPLMAIPFMALVPMPSYVHRPLWYAANFLMLVIVIQLLLRLLRNAPRVLNPAPWAFWGLVILLSARHVLAIFENQSNDMLVLLMVMGAAYASCLARDKTSGMFVGIGAAAKASPLLFLPVFLWQRRFMAAAAVIAGGAVALLAIDLLFPRPDAQLWVQSWYKAFVAGINPFGSSAENLSGVWPHWNILNQNLAATIYRLSTPVTESTVDIFDVSLWRPDVNILKSVTVGAQLAVLGVILWALTPARSRQLSTSDLAWRRFGEAGMVVCGMLLLSPMSSKAHFAVLLIPIVYCCYELLYVRRSVFVIICMSLLLFASVTTRSFIGRSLGDEILARGSVTLCALAALVASARLLTRSDRG